MNHKKNHTKTYKNITNIMQQQIHKSYKEVGHTVHDEHEH